MRYPEKPRGQFTEGWALDGIRRFGEKRPLCAVFRRMVFEDGVPVRPSTAHAPASLALTQTELMDRVNAYPAIMGITGELRQAAFEKFPPLSSPEKAPSPKPHPVEEAHATILYRAIVQHRRQQTAAAIPSEQLNR